MNRMWLAGLLPLLLAAPPGRAQDFEARRHRPRVHQHPGPGVSPDPSRPARDLPDQGAGRPEGRLRVLR